MKLAIGIAVVGSHRCEFFEAVFGIMLDWQVKYPLVMIGCLFYLNSCNGMFCLYVK